jgi:acyl carrier protein
VTLPIGSDSAKESAAGQPAYGLAETVLEGVREIGRDYGRDAAVTLDDSLIEDLGFDSLMFVDLTLLLEDRLGVEEFPMRSWVDDESNFKTGKRFTVRSLLRTCVTIETQSHA